MLFLIPAAIKGGVCLLHAASAHCAGLHTAVTTPAATTHAAATHTATTHAAATHTATTHAAATHTAATHAARVSAAAGFSSGTLINAATVAGAAFLLVYNQEIIKLAASARRGLSSSQLRDIRDKAYRNTLDALNRTLTQAEQDELTVVLSRLGI
jgi:hypothetical protein